MGDIIIIAFILDDGYNLEMFNSFLYWFLVINISYPCPVSWARAYNSWHLHIIHLKCSVFF